MPSYDFRCESCNKTYELKMKIAEHAELKDTLTCQECHGKLTQAVSRLNFTLKGEGWFPARADDYDPAYHGIDKSDFAKNLDMEKKVEDLAMNYMDKEPND